MPQQFLHGAQVAAGFEQMTGERVAQAVRVQMLGQAAFFRLRHQPELHATLTEAPPLLADEQCRLVLGGELAYDKLDIDTIGDNNDVVRAGVLAGYDAGRFMPYLAGGYAYLDTDAFGTSQNDNGYYYGVGATYAVTSSIRVGVEYLEHRFDDFDNTGVDIKAKTTSLKASFAF